MMEGSRFFPFSVVASEKKAFLLVERSSSESKRGPDGSAWRTSFHATSAVTLMLAVEWGGRTSWDFLKLHIELCFH